MTLPGQLGLPLATPRPAGATPAMGDRLCALLVRRGRPLEVGQVASQLLRLRRCPEVMQRRLVAQIVDGDHRLAWLGRDLVGLAPMDWRARDIRTGSFCVVDLETTGGSPGRSKITEIGAVRVRDMRIVERFSTLVDPGRPIPEVITALTGIDDATVAGAPAIEQALDAFVAFAGDDVLVAHNAPFDLRFLNHERRMASGTYFTQPWLDTLTMARRLLAGRVSRNDLTSLSEWADTTVRPCHRALPDAEATAELLLRFLEMLVDDGHDTLERAVRFAAPGGTRHSWKLALADELPSGPGVYLMRDRRGGVLYVGKARDLRRRVRSYFGPGGRHGRLIGRALEQLERIDHECCDSDLDALLREAVLLRELQPPCNRRGVGGRVRVLRVVGGEFARLRLAPDPDRGDRIAVVHGERTGALALRALHRLHPIRDCHPLCPPHAGLGPPARPCAGPCGQDDPAAHAAAMHDVAALFGEHPGPALAGLGRRLMEAARDGRWIADRESRDELHALLGLARRQWRTHTATLRVAFLAEPGGVAGRAVLFGVVRGAVVMRVVADAGDVDARVEQVLDAMATALGAAAPPAPPEVAAILEQRIRDRGAPGAVACGPAGPDPGERHLALLAARWALGMSGRSAGREDDGA